MTFPDPPPSVRPVDYKGEPLDAERGPGLGCFWLQVGVLVILLVLTPLTVAWSWPAVISAALLIATLLLLLFAGQTVIFLLRLVAADRRQGTRHAPRRSATPTVGQLEDVVHVDGLGRPIDGPAPAAGDDAQPGPPDEAQPGDAGVRE